MSLTDKILNHCKQRIDGLELAPYGDGRFEVFVGEEKIYSKLETGDFPDDEPILAEIDERL